VTAVPGTPAIGTHGGEFGEEPVAGLPAALPPGERILWQGRPHWPSLARHAFHVRLVAGYFALLGLWRGLAAYEDGAGATDVALALLTPAAIGALVIAAAAAVAWYAARTTRYTITTRRVVMRIGMALTVSVNLPFAVVAKADLRRHRDGTGDISLALLPPARASFVVFWPHARPWHFRRPQPMLRGLSDPDAVAQILSRALAAAASMPVAPLVADRPERDPAGAAPVAA
jgi:hypothetical protein